MKQTNASASYRTVWLSDIHLGNKDCHTQYLKQFLLSMECTRLYLVGDIIDVIAMKRRLWCTESHYEILQILQKKAADGTEIIYVPGNHDDVMREYCGGELLNVKLLRKAIHETADGRRLLVVHGDEFDHAVIVRNLYKVIGESAYSFMVFMNRWLARFRRIFGLPYWSLATYIKTHVGEARKTIENFERAAAKFAKEQGLDGIVCGHIHRAAIKEIEGVLYCNDGDWTESCTALTEDASGKLDLLHWTDIQSSGHVVNISDARVA